MLATRLQQLYSEAPVPLTEAHPKALLRFLGLQDKPWSDVQRCFGLEGSEPASLHGRDAVLAAVAAREGEKKLWRDLSLDVHRYKSELDPKLMWFGEVSYFWPDRNNPAQRRGRPQDG